MNRCVGPKCLEFVNRTCPRYVRPRQLELSPFRSLRFVRPRFVRQTVCDMARIEHFDYVVIGTHGRTGLARALAGSVAEGVVRLSTCAVISVKPSDHRTA